MIFLSFAYSASKIGQTLNQTKVVGYYQPRASGIQLKDMDVSKLTHLLYAFGNVLKDGSATFSGLGSDSMDWTAWSTSKVVEPADNTCPCGTTCLKGYLNQLWTVKRNNPSLRTVLSFGGWAWSHNFSAVFKDSTARANLIKTTTDFMTKYGFDGIDIDWEFPTNMDRTKSEPTYTADPADFTNIGTFLQETRAYWKAQNLPEDTILSIAMPPQLQEFTTAKSIFKVINQYASFIMVMSYEFQHNDKINRLGAGLFAAPEDTPAEKSLNVDNGIKDYNGVDPLKIVMGIPLYATGFKNFNQNTGNRKAMKCLGDTFQGEQSGTAHSLVAVDYKTIMSTVTGNQFGYGGYQYDPIRGSSSACNGTHFYSFDTVESVALKAKYIQDKKLGGIMMWDLSQDIGEKDDSKKSMFASVKSAFNTPASNDRKFEDICLQKSDYCNLLCSYTPDQANSNQKKANTRSSAFSNSVDIVLLSLSLFLQ